MKEVFIHYFGAVWCAPCKMLKPQLAKAIKRLEEKGVVVHISWHDVDNDPSAARTYDVRSVPIITIGKADGMARVETRLVGGMATAANAREAVERMLEL